MTESDPTGIHNWHSAAYVQDWISVNSERDHGAVLRAIVQHIPFDPEERIRVLDIGGGWGPLTEVILEAFPHARVVLHDFSEPMLMQARARLAAHGDSVTYLRGDLMTSVWTSGLAGQLDAVVSHIAIHNVRFPDRIRAIYQDIFPLVAKGGCFINSDHPGTGVLAGRASGHAQQMAQRYQIYEQTGQWTRLHELPARSGAGRNLHAHAEPSREDLERIASHEPATVANQLRWLLEAGFDEVECFAREGRDMLIGAFRAK